MAWEERTGLVQAGAATATGNDSFQYVMGGNSEDEAWPLKDAQ